MKAGKTAIATVLGADVADLERYQPTRNRGVFTDGSDYYTSRAVGSTKLLPGGFEWEKIPADWFETRYAIEVFRARNGGD